MSEISKLYKNAGKELEYRYTIKGKEITVESCDKNAIIALFSKPKTNFKVIKVDREMYFTAEKQLNLILWLGANKQGIGIDLWKYKNEQIWNCGIKFEWEEYRYSFKHNEFKQALAGLVNFIWKDLTPKQQQEIKEIL